MGPNRGEYYRVSAICHIHIFSVSISLSSPLSPAPLLPIPSPLSLLLIRYEKHGVTRIRTKDRNVSGAGARGALARQAEITYESAAVAEQVANRIKIGGERLNGVDFFESGAVFQTITIGRDGSEDAERRRVLSAVHRHGLVPADAPRGLVGMVQSSGGFPPVPMFVQARYLTRGTVCEGGGCRGNSPCGMASGLFTAPLGKWS